MSSYVSDSEQSFMIMSEGYSSFDPTALAGFELFKLLLLDVKYINEDKIIQSKMSRIRIFERIMDNELAEVRIEILTDLDVCFFIECNINDKEYEEIKSSNNLLVGFDQFSQSFVDVLDMCLKKPKEYEINIISKNDDLEFQFVVKQALRMRFVNLMCFDFVKSDKDFIRSQVQHRFNALKIEAQNKLQEVETKFARLKSINPQVSDQMRKNVELTVEKKLLIESM